MGKIVRTANKVFFSKGDTTNWSREFYTLINKNNDTTPNFHRKMLTEIYNESWLSKQKFSLKAHFKLILRFELSGISF